jgi:hypothetical protein
MTVSSGAFNLTGTSVNFKRDLAVFAGSGNYPLTGTTTGLVANHKLTASQEVFLLNGSIVDFCSCLKLLVNTLVLTVLAPEADLKRDYIFTVENQGYYLAENSAAIAAHKIQTTDTTSFDLDAYEVGFRRGQQFIVDTGCFDLSGGNITSHQDYSTIAAPASYGLEEMDIPLVAALTFSPLSASFSVFSFFTFVDRTLTCETGSFNLTGIAIDITSTGDVNSFGSYEPNYVGLIEVLIDFKLTLQNIANYAFPSIGFTRQTFENVFQGDALYMRASDGKVGRAVANSTVDLATVVGFAETTKLAGESVRVLTTGKLATSGLTQGQQYFLSAVSPGAITATPPSGANNHVVFIGEACSNSELIVNIKFPVALA